MYNIYILRRQNKNLNKIDPKIVLKNSEGVIDKNVVQ